MPISLFDKVKNTIREKEKMLVTSIFSFTKNVFKNLLPQGHFNLGLEDKQLRKWSAGVLDVRQDPSCTYLDLSVILACMARSLAGGIYAPPVLPVRISAPSALGFLVGGAVSESTFESLTFTSSLALPLKTKQPQILAK